MGRGKNREKRRKIKHMYIIFYTGGSSAPFTNHDRSYRSRGSDDLRPAGPVMAPATAGGTQVVILASPGYAPSRLPRSIIFYAMATVYASWYSATLQRDSISNRSACFCHESWKFKRREAGLNLYGAGCSRNASSFS